jgi:hypothetical protein
VDGRIAGYNWARREGQAQVPPGDTQVSIPDEYFYDYASLTLPEYRGLGLSTYRQDQLFKSDVCTDKIGLFGFVRSTNYPMRKALAGSGGRTVASIWVFGTQHHCAAYVSRSARRLGISRVKSPRLADGHAKP